MFKQIILVASALVALTIAASSCGGGKTEEVVDSTAVDTSMVMEAAPDTVAQAPTVEVPAAVTAAFQAKYPTATVAADGWESEDEGIYEVEFTMDSKTYEAEFDSTGVWRETDTPMQESEVPAAVTKSLKAGKYKAATVLAIESLELPKYPKLVEYQLAKGTDTMTVRFDEKGKEVVIK